MEIGTDIVEIKRLISSYRELADRCLSSGEMKELNLIKNEEKKAAYVAKRWAGKEAFIKASGLKTASFKDIEVLDDPSGRPHLYFKGKETGKISLSDDVFALAFVVLSSPAESL